MKGCNSLPTLPQWTRTSTLLLLTNFLHLPECRFHVILLINSCWRETLQCYYVLLVKYGKDNRYRKE